MIYEDSYNPMLSFCDWPIYLEDVISEKSEHSYATFYSYTEYDRKQKQYVRHIYAIRRIKRKGFECKEVRRDYEKKDSVFRDLYYSSYGASCGTHVVFDTKYYYYQKYEPESVWHKMDEYYYNRMPNYVVELNTIESIIAADLDLRYCGYVPQKYVELFDYIKQYHKYPIVETFMKLGLYRLILNQKAIDVASTNKTFRKWLNAHAGECQDRAFQHIYNAYKKNPNGSVEDYCNSLQYRIQCGYEVAAKDKELYNYILKYTNQEKLYSYLEDNNISNNNYWDYIEACRWLKLDFNDTKVLYPKDFNTYHDLYTKQYAEHKRDIEKEKNKALDKKMTKVAKKYNFINYENGMFMVLVASSKEELIDEGAALNHCVGRMNYDERQIKEESLICFLRNKDKPEEPFVTIEFDLNNKKIRQRYAKNNTQPNEDVLNFIDSKWLPHIKKAWKKEFANV